MGHVGKRFSGSISQESTVCSKERAPVNSDKLIIRLALRKAQLMELPNDNLQGDLPPEPASPEPQAYKNQAPGPEAHTLPGIWVSQALTCCPSFQSSLV